MTGIVGMIAHDHRRPIAGAEVEALAAAYESLRGVGQRHAAGGATFARLIKIDTASADRPGIEQRDGSWAAATGVLLGTPSLIGADLAALDGQFALISYDRDTDSITVATDPFGMHALYLAERQDTTYISSSALALAQHLGARPSRLGLAVLLCCGMQSGPITNWEGIERLDPAIRLQFGPAGRSRTTYWQPAVDEAITRLDFRRSVDYAIDAVGETFRSSFVGRGYPWVDLTGGYDTRLLALLLRRAGVGFRTNTVGKPSYPDVIIARRIASLAGWDWTRFRVPETWPELAPPLARAALAWADGRLPAQHLAQVLWAHQQKGRVHPQHLAGGGGDVYRGKAWRQEFLRAGRSTHVNYDNLIAMVHLKIDDTSLLAPGLVDDVVAYLRTWMMAHTRQYAGALNTVQLDVLLAATRPAWDGIFGSAAGAYLCSALPFFLKPSFTTAFSIDYRYRNHHRLMRAMIERLDPRIAAIPTTSGGPAQEWRASNLHRFAPYYALIGRAAINKLSQKAWGHGLLPSPTQEDLQASEGERALLTDLALDPATMRSATLFREHALRAMLCQARQPGSNERMLGRILTVEMAMRAGDSTRT